MSKKIDYPKAPQFKKVDYPRVQMLKALYQNLLDDLNLDVNKILTLDKCVNHYLQKEEYYLAYHICLHAYMILLKHGYTLKVKNSFFKKRTTDMKPHVSSMYYKMLQEFLEAIKEEEEEIKKLSKKEAIKELPNFLKDFTFPTLSVEVKDFDDFESLYGGFVDKVDYSKNIKFMPLFIDTLIKRGEQERQYFYFAMELSLYFVSEHEDFLDNKKLPEVIKKTIVQEIQDYRVLLNDFTNIEKDSKRIEAVKAIVQTATTVFYNNYK